MASDLWKCAECCRPLRIVFGRWLPVCNACIPSISEVMEGWRDDGAKWCWRCGSVAAATDESTGWPPLCEPCRATGNLADENSGSRYCPLCRAETTIATLFDEWRIQPNERRVVGHGGYICRRCLRGIEETLPALARGAGEQIEREQSYNWSPADLKPNEDFCLAKRVRAEERASNDPAEGWRRYFHYDDIRKLEAIIASVAAPCSDALLSEEERPLPDHVCMHTLVESCARAFPLQAAPSPDASAEAALRSLELPEDVKATLMREVSVPESELADWRGRHAEYLRLLAVGGGRNPAWEVFGHPTWPMKALWPGLVGGVLRRRREGASVTLYAMIEPDRAESLRFVAPRVSVTLQTTDAMVRRWATEQEDKLVKWYEVTLLGQDVPSRGRKVGSAPVLQEVSEVYLQLVIEACARLKKQPQNLSARDIALQAQLTGVGVAEQTISGWWREGRLARPETLRNLQLFSD